MLLILGLFGDKLPIWAAAIVPSLFILFHSGGPGANGKSLSSLSFRGELRAGANGVIGALGSIGAAVGLLIFPIFRERYGLNNTFLILSSICWRQARAHLAIIGCVPSAVGKSAVKAFTPRKGTYTFTLKQPEMLLDALLSY